MKANELMIGDWVQIVEPCKYAGAIGRIKKLIDHKDDENAYFKVFLQNNTIHIGIEDICSDDIRPIPLTPEILEKNGFEKTQIHGEKQDDIFQCFDGEIIIEVGIYDPNFILVHYSYKTPDGINSVEISSIVKVDGGKFYLHELQHALRLCSISKEIEL